MSVGYVPLRYVTSILARGTAPDYVDDGPVRMVSQAANQGEGLDWERTRFHSYSGDPRKLKGYLYPGDSLVNSTGTGTLGRIGWFEAPPDERPCVADGHVTVVRFDPAVVEPRFGHYYLKNGSFQEFMFETLVSGSTNQIELSRDRMRAVAMPVPPLEEQRRIADFLDAETARIDKFRDMTERQRMLLSDRQRLAFHRSVQDEGGPDLSVLDIDDVTGLPGWDLLPLNRVLRQLTNGYVGPTRELLVDSGVPYLQSLHIKNGRIDFWRKPYYVPHEWADSRPRISLSAGDVVIVQTGAIGEVGVVEPEHAGFSCHALLIARTNPNVLYPRFLWQVLTSYWGNNTLLKEQTGALHPHLEAGKIWYVTVPVPSLAVQERIVSRTDEILQNSRDVDAKLGRRMALLAERRQALITAAVTGQIDVSTASGRGIEG